MPVLIEEVRACVAAVVGSAQVAQLAADAPLVETGLVSSMELVAVAAAIEQQFGIAVPAAAVTVANFNTLAALARMIERLRLGARVAAAPADTVDRPVLQSLAACLRRPIWLALLIAAFSNSAIDCIR
jgi:acyl carrier protein